MDDDVCEPDEQARERGPTKRVTILFPADELDAMDEVRLAMAFPPTRTAFIRSCVRDVVGRAKESKP